MQAVRLRRGPKDGLGELAVSNQTSSTLLSSRRIWTGRLFQCAPMVLEEKPSSLLGESIMSHINVTVIDTEPQTKPD